MIYGSVCSGIESASQAWQPLGWQPAFYSEIEPFPCAVLNFRHPEIPNHGDMAAYEGWPDHAIELLVGGTPCQAFSIAGLRRGLGDPRGNLMLTYGAIVRRYRPRWLVWENVPGVLSRDAGRDFASLLGLLSGRRIETPADGWRTAGIVEGYKGAYGLAWRVLDAQYIRVDGFPFAVPQRRRRVFVVGYSGNWRNSAAVLFEPESLRGDNPPRRTAGQNIAPQYRAGASFGGWFDAITARLVSFGEYQECGFASTIQSRDFKYCTDLIAVPGPRKGGWQVRRLTITESERLQGFPDGFTAIPWEGEPVARDAPRYRALGNAMAVNCMEWIGRRIEMVDRLEFLEAAQ